MKKFTNCIFLLLITLSSCNRPFSWHYSHEEHWPNNNVGNIAPHDYKKFYINGNDTLKCEKCGYTKYENSSFPIGSSNLFYIDELHNYKEEIDIIHGPVARFDLLMDEIKSFKEAGFSEDLTKKYGVNDYLINYDSYHSFYCAFCADFVMGDYFFLANLQFISLDKDGLETSVSMIAAFLTTDKLTGERKLVFNEYNGIKYFDLYIGDAVIGTASYNVERIDFDLTWFSDYFANALVYLGDL